MLPGGNSCPHFLRFSEILFNTDSVTFGSEFTMNHTANSEQYNLEINAIATLIANGTWISQNQSQIANKKETMSHMNEKESE